MKQTFVRSGEWSEYGENESGAIPCALVMPDEMRVEIDNKAQVEAQWDLGQSRSRYARMTPAGEVRVRETLHGDDPRRRQGRYRIILEVIAPKGSTFFFASNCPWCGEKVREYPLGECPGEPDFHDACRKYQDAIEAHIQEQQEADRKDRLAEEAHLRALGYVL